MGAILLSIFTFISTLLGGVFGIKHKDKLHYIMSFTAGVLIAVCFFDILPEVTALSIQEHLNITNAFISLVIGFLAFHILEKTIIIHHGHEHEYAEHKHQAVGVFGASGLSFHSFLDGVGIGLGFHISPHTGLLIALAVIAHDFSDGLNTVTLMLRNRNSIKRTVAFLLLDALTPILGVASTYFFSIPNNLFTAIFRFFCRFFTLSRSNRFASRST